ERAEVAGRKRQSPWLIERSVGESHDQRAVGVELVDLSDRRRPFRVGNKQVAVDGGDVVGGETGWQTRIRKSAGGGSRIEAGVEHVDRARCLVIGRIEQV